jgi:hypothetical protein
MQIKNMLQSRLLAVVAGAAVVGMLGAGAGWSAATISSADIRNNTIKGKDLKPGLVKRLDESAEIKAAQTQVTGLAARVDALEKKLNAVSTGQVGAPFAAKTRATVTATTVTLTEINDPQDGGSSAETPNLNKVVSAGDTITFNVAFSNGATCVAGAPRMFVEIQGVPGFTNSFDQATPCAGGTAAPNSTNGTISFKVPQNGRLGYAGFAYDSDVPGTITITGLTVAGTPVPFA